MDELKQYYCGFYIDQPVSNNAFSFESRRLKKIYVAPLVHATVDDVKVGTEAAFCEVIDGNEIVRNGLRSFVYWKAGAKHIFIFDNHNHAFVFWVWALSRGIFSQGAGLAHIDQHKDTRRPAVGFEEDLKSPRALEKAFEYANTVLNVGNFIPPALERGFFSEVIHCDRSAVFSSNGPASEVLDIDMDIFSKDMEYIPEELKVGFIREQIRHAKFITIATSPYFIEQEKGVTILHQIFQSDQRWS